MPWFVNMRQFVRKILNIINRIIEKTSWYNNYWGGVCKFWHFEKKYVKVINLGSNSAKNAFSYANAQVSGLNMALGPQSLVHDYAILKNYFSYLEDNGIVLITLCPFSCLKVNYTIHHNLKYYTILHPATIAGFNESERQRALIIQNNPFKAMPLKCCLAVLKEVAYHIVPKKVVKPDFVKHANQIVKMWKEQFSISELDTPLTSEHRRYFIERSTTLSDMIQFCETRGLRPYVVLPPVHKALSDMLSPAFMTNYVYDFVKAAGADDIFLNYFNDSLFQNDDYFQNSFYLNIKGAKIFTNELLNKINNQ